MQIRHEIYNIIYEKRITAALLTAILIISCFPSGVMTTISRADDAKRRIY